MNTTLEEKKIILDSFESDCPELDYDNFKEDFELFWKKELKEYGYFLKGTIRMWYRKGLGYSKVCDNPQDLYNYISNYDYIKVAVEYSEGDEQHLIFYLAHHDGTHSMELYSITERGYNYLNENYGYIDKYFLDSKEFYKPVQYIKKRL